MKSQFIRIIMLLYFTVGSSSLKGQEGWLQFRGPGSCGISQSTPGTPIIPDLEKNLVWTTNIASGLSSPVVYNNMIFLTGYEKTNKALITYCINLTNGKVIWERKMHPDTIETFHQMGNPAASTPVTDGKAVYVYFGSYGVLCYDLNGKLLWEQKMPLLNSMYGSSSSPVLGNNLIIIHRHDNKNPSVLALDKRTGNKVWEHFILFPEGISSDRTWSQATPVIWRDQVIIHSYFQLRSLNLSDGKMSWSYRLASTGVGTPVIMNDTLYVNGHLNLGESDLYDEIPVFSEMINKYDADKDGHISGSEIPEQWAIQKRPELKGLNLQIQADTMFPTRMVVPFVDSDKNKKLSSEEWSNLIQLTQSWRQEHGTVALKLNPKIKAAAPVLLWKVADKVPEVPSVLAVNGRVYTVCDGGIITCINARTGSIIFRDRLKGTSLYLSSPLYAKGCIYVIAHNGIVNVINPADKLTVRGTYRIGTRIGSSPAVVGNTLLIRDEVRLMAFKAL